MVLSKVIDELLSYLGAGLPGNEDLAFIYVRIGFLAFVHHPHTLGVVVSRAGDTQVFCLIGMERDGGYRTVGTMLDVEVKCMDQWERPKSVSSCSSRLGSLELDRTRMDRCPELVVHLVAREVDPVRFDPKTDTSVRVGYRFEFRVVRVVGVEPCPDCERIVDLASCDVERRGLPISTSDELGDLVPVD